MRKVFTFFALSLIGGVFFSSCSRYSDVAIAKRHYRSGYYVERSGRPVKTQAVVVSNAAGLNQAPDVQAPKDSHVRPSGSVPALSRLLASKLIQKKATHLLERNIPEPIVTPARTGPELKDARQLKLMYHDRHGDGGLGHLLWVIIIVLLLLWLLSLLLGGFGLGGLIYILLVIALVLIVLRLLMII